MVEGTHWTQNRSESSKPPGWTKTTATPAAAAQAPREEEKKAPAAKVRSIKLVIISPCFPVCLA